MLRSYLLAVLLLGGCRSTTPAPDVSTAVDAVRAPAGRDGEALSPCSDLEELVVPGSGGLVPAPVEASVPRPTGGSIEVLRPADGIVHVMQGDPGQEEMRYSDFVFDEAQRRLLWTGQTWETSGSVAVTGTAGARVFTYAPSAGDPVRFTMAHLATCAEAVRP